MARTVLQDQAEAFYREMHAEAVHLAGGIADLPRRAAVYHHIYRASGGNFAFALIAAHGALWAHWYLVAARVAAWILSALDISSSYTPAEKLAAYDAYVRELEDVNRRVMIETYTIFHFTRRYGRHPDARRIMPAALLDLMIACHEAADGSGQFPQAQKRALYDAFFRWEQHRVVGPAVDAALSRFDWKLMRNLCLRPWVWFSYFRFGRSLNFRDFSSSNERIEKGLKAFDFGARQGWSGMEHALVTNRFMPRGFADDPDTYFEMLKDTGAHPLRKQSARLEALFVGQS